MARLALLTCLAFVALCGDAAAQVYQGPSGGRGGSPFDFWKESGGATKVQSVGVIETGTIRCLVIAYRETPTNPGRVTAYRHGTCGTAAGEIGFDKSHGFRLDPDEYLIGVAGRYGEYIDSIRFYTNKRNSPVYNETAGGLSFGYTAPRGQMIVAFTGRAGENLDAIGVMFAPCSAYATCK